MIKRNLICIILSSLIFQGCLTTKTEPQDLTEAVKSGNKGEVTQLLESGSDPNWISETGHTALHFAIISSDVSMIQLLLDNGADINIKGPREVSSLGLAVMAHQWDNANFLIENGADNSISELNKILSLTIQLGLPEASVFVLNELKADPTKDSMLLLIAAINKEWDIAKLLVEKGIDVNVREGKGRSVLRYSLENIDIIKTLIEAGVNVNNIPNDGVPPLSYAVKSQNIDLINLLIDSGAELNPAYTEEKENGRTPLPPLMILSFSNIPDNIEIAELLFKKGANLNYLAVDDDGKSITALTMALMTKKTNFAKFLIENGADVTLGSSLGSPLELSEKSELNEITEEIKSKIN